MSLMLPKLYQIPLSNRPYLSFCAVNQQVTYKDIKRYSQAAMSYSKTNSKNQNIKKEALWNFHECYDKIRCGASISKTAGINSFVDDLKIVILFFKKIFKLCWEMNYGNNKRADFFIRAAG